MKNTFLFILLNTTIMYSQKKIMTPELLWKLGRVNIEAISPNKKKIIYSVTNYDIETEKATKNIFSLDIKSKIYSQINTGGSDYTFSPNGELYFIDDSKLILFEELKNKRIIFDFKNNSVSNILFSPKGNKILYSKEVKTGKDIKDVYPRYKNANVKIYDDLMVRHWDTWRNNFYSHIFIADFNNQTIENEKDIMPDEMWDCPIKPFGGKEQLGWSKDSKSIFYSCKKLFGKDYATSTNSEIYQYNIDSESINNISEGIKGYDRDIKVSNNGKYIAWLSMKEDGNEADKQDIVLYDIEKKQRYNLTENWDETIDDFKWDENDNCIIFRTHINATIQLFKLTFDKKFRVAPEKNIKQITSGWHDIGNFFLTEKFAIATKQTMNQANEIYFFNLKNGIEEKITSVNDFIYDSIDTPEITQRWIETSDNKKMLVWVILPPNFDKTKKYPSILYCQGGPQSTVSQFYSFRWNFQLMASNGYVVIAPNRRGLPSFGTKWNADISGDWGGQPIRDYISAVDSIKKEPFIDENKIGAVGASYGGYSVNMLAGIHKKRFKAFISHCGVFSTKDMYGTTEESFFSNHENGGNYWDNPGLPIYNEFDPLSFVKEWDTPIMIIHGGKDFRIPYTQGLHAFQVARMKNLPSKFIFFPEENHWVLRMHNSLIWHAEFLNWLDKWLK